MPRRFSGLVALYGLNAARDLRRSGRLHELHARFCELVAGLCKRTALHRVCERCAGELTVSARRDAAIRERVWVLKRVSRRLTVLVETQMHRANRRTRDRVDRHAVINHVAVGMVWVFELARPVSVWSGALARSERAAIVVTMLWRVRVRVQIKLPRLSRIRPLEALLVLWRQLSAARCIRLIAGARFSCAFPSWAHPKLAQ